ncbi:MAG: hypothetical protein M3O71_15645 [Bacteroidota bacterium]|nr:hypothetical protein [Bacteroidota bacterium]
MGGHDHVTRLRTLPDILVFAIGMTPFIKQRKLGTQCSGGSAFCQNDQLDMGVLFPDKTYTNIEAFGRLLNAMGVNHSDFKDLSASAKGWPLQMDVLRNERFVGKVPMEYCFDGRLIISSTEGQKMLEFRD